MDNNLDVWWEYAYNDASPTSSYGSAPENKSVAARFIEYEKGRHRNFFRLRQGYALGDFKSYFGLSSADIEALRQEIAAENSPPTQIYQAFIASGSIEAAIALSNQLDTVFRSFDQ